MTNTYKKIQEAKARNEQSMIDLIEMFNFQDEGYKPFNLRKAHYHALDRLVEGKKIKYRKLKNYTRRGYWVIDPNRVTGG